jgi:hypothetical protein
MSGDIHSGIALDRSLTQGQETELFAHWSA